MIESSLSPNTRKAYGLALTLGSEYRENQMLTIGMVTDILTYLYEQGKVPNIIALTLAGIKFGCRLQEMDVTGDLTKCTMSGIKRNRKKRKRGRGRSSGKYKDTSLLQSYRKLIDSPTHPNHEIDPERSIAKSLVNYLNIPLIPNTCTHGITLVDSVKQIEMLESLTNSRV